ncbi:MAG: lipid droplet-associated protein [Mycobacterium sp.]|nr:MAG: lipid droplet-associated protein [Mycobacterium sp.]
MATAPYGVRLLVGAAVTAIEETRKLPQTVLMYPITMASTVAQIVMKVQQDLADLAIKGDAALESLFPPKVEQPDWATFDEDLGDQPAPRAQAGTERRTEGRFALYSVADPETAAGGKSGLGGSAPEGRRAATEPPSGAVPPGPSQPVVAPPIAEELEYDGLTLAQLRARLSGLSVEDLRALLAYEEAGRARAPFQTLLANRITRATAK